MAGIEVLVRRNSRTQRLKHDWCWFECTWMKNDEQTKYDADMGENKLSSHESKTFVLFMISSYLQSVSTISSDKGLDVYPDQHTEAKAL